MKVTTNCWKTKSTEKQLSFSRVMTYFQQISFCSISSLQKCRSVMFFSGKHVHLSSGLPSARSMALKLHVSTVCKVAVPSDGNGRANAVMLFKACLLNACSKLAEVNRKWHQRVLDKLCLCPIQRSSILLPHVADCISSAKVGVKQRYHHL